MEIPISELAELVGGTAIDPAGEFAVLKITGFASLLDARPGDVAFFNYDRYLDDLKATTASAVLVGNDFELEIPGVLPIKVEDPIASIRQSGRGICLSPAFVPARHPPQRRHRGGCQL